ncbi:MAG: metal ABC transporter substrate-binding protein, partial [Coriobacteriales bacterium]|nr:metal ABC transporter substrate-binding protein [Coriobacteriales bacterium]
TEEGEVDANYFQHQPYLDSFNEEKGTHLVSVAKVHFEPFGLYAGRTSSLAELKEGALVAVPNDTTNEARALLLLQQEGLLTLKEGAGITATPLDIAENPLKLQFQELAAEAIPQILPDVDIAAINGNYAINAGLKVEDALAVEASDSLAAETYGNVIVVREADKDSLKAQALTAAILTPEVKDYIAANYAGAVLATF